MEAAGKIGGPSGLMLLAVGLGDDDVEVARTAAGALRRSGPAPGAADPRRRASAPVGPRGAAPSPR